MQSMNSQRSWCRLAVLLLFIILVIVLGQAFGLGKSPLAGPTLTPTPITEPEVVQLVPSPAPAVQAFLWWDAAIAERDLHTVQEGLHFRWVKQMFAWRDIEGNVKGTFDWVNADRVVEQAE